MSLFRSMNATSIAMAAFTSSAIGFSTRTLDSRKSRSLRTAASPLAFSFLDARRPLVLPFRSNRVVISCMVANQ